MKKITKNIALTLAFASLLLSYSAFASVISVSPAAITVTTGQRVTLTVRVDAQGSNISTVSSRISYPMNLLTPTSFTFNPAWIPLTQNGYDQMTAGTVIKTGGFPRGFTGTQTLGTLVFTANAAGVANIAVLNSSLAYTATGQNMTSGVQGSSTVTVTAPVPGTTPTTQIGAPTTATGTTIAPALTDTTVSETPAATGETQTVPLSANANGTGSTIPVWGWILAIVVIIGLVLLGRFLYKRNQTPAAPVAKK